MTIETEIADIVRNASAQISATIREEAVQIMREAHASFYGTFSPARDQLTYKIERVTPAATSPKKPRTGRKDGGYSLSNKVKQVLNLIRANAAGMRSEDLQKALHLDKAEIASCLTVLKRHGYVKTKGTTRWTTYTAANGRRKRT